jgi:hypothetical protein
MPETKAQTLTVLLQVYSYLAMTTAAMATYAYDQIDQARTQLEHPS